MGIRKLSGVALVCRGQPKWVLQIHQPPTYGNDFTVQKCHCSVGGWQLTVGG